MPGGTTSAVPVANCARLLEEARTRLAAGPTAPTGVANGVQIAANGVQPGVANGQQGRQGVQGTRPAKNANRSRR